MSTVKHHSDGQIKIITVDLSENGRTDCFILLSVFNFLENRLKLPPVSGVEIVWGERGKTVNFCLSCTQKFVDCVCFVANFEFFEVSGSWSDLRVFVCAARRSGDGEFTRLQPKWLHTHGVFHPCITNQR